MKDLNKRTEFEDFWKETFSHAEMSPSENVWDRIDASLSREEAGIFRKRAFIYKLLAAASVAFALGIGVWSLYNYQEHSDSQIAQQATDLESAQVQVDPQDALIPELGTVYDDESKQIAQVSDIDETGAFHKQDVAAIIPSGHSSAEYQPDDDNELFMPSHMPEPATGSFTLTTISPMGLEPETFDEIALAPEHIYLIPIMPRGASKKKIQDDKKLTLLAGLDFGTGMFDPNFGPGSTTPSTTMSPVYGMMSDARFNDQLTSFNTVNKEFLLVRSTGRETEPEVSFSYGANVGMHLTNRIILQTGISYRKSNSSTTTTGYIEGASNGERIPIIAAFNYELGGLYAVNRIEETSVNNQFEFLSVPLRLGYVLLDRKLNIAMLAGASSDFFINNSISDRSNYLETLSSSSGASSPYRDVFFNGLVGTQFGYSFAGNYLLTVEPGYRFAINSFTKDNFYMSSFPSSFMVSFGLTYILK